MAKPLEVTCHDCGRIVQGEAALFYARYLLRPLTSTGAGERVAPAYPGLVALTDAEIPAGEDDRAWLTLFEGHDTKGGMPCAWLFHLYSDKAGLAFEDSLPDRLVIALGWIPEAIELEMHQLIRHARKRNVPKTQLATIVQGCIMGSD